MALSGSCQNRFCYAFDIGHHVEIGEADYAEAQGCEAMIATLIVLAIMRVTIDLDRETDRRTEEIDNRVRFYNDMLTAKLETAELAVGQGPPQPLLGFRRVTTHLVRTPQQFSLVASGVPHPNPSPEGEGL